MLQIMGRTAVLTLPKKDTLARNKNINVKTEGPLFHFNLEHRCYNLIGSSSIQ